jgi:hypothetical protein
MLNSMGDVAIKQSISHAFYTYVHINSTTNKIFYVGKGTKSRYLATARRNPHWQNIVNKHGFKAEILAYWKTSEEALSHEKTLISCFNDMKYVLANKTSGGEDCQLSEETRKKIGIAQVGKKRSLESCKKMSEAALKRKPITGWKHSEETKQKIKQKLIGRIMSEESRLKMIATKLAKRGQS